jgi:hypothetical protein
MELVLLSDAQPTDWWARWTVIKQLLAYRCEPTDDAQQEGVTRRPPIQCSGTEGILEEDWGQVDPVYTFSDYNVMLVDLKYMVLSPPNVQGQQELTQMYERAGRGCLHCKALERALVPGPERRRILLR